MASRQAQNQRRQVTRCAIYTRKSTEEGLDQEFNSLDAQREACAAYILSQRHEGWYLVPEQYDDGGFSGGNMERPGLKQLVADVAAGKVDVIVVYKVDRLTRALSDFAKIVEILDGAGASFVSVTQSFNTTTSMGRLTLNVLLSFAQFEREVTGERIRDKIAASKAKGMWMGGTVPLGYDVRERKLVVNASEAVTVRYIYRSYIELGSTGALSERLASTGIRSKRRLLSNGEVQGDKAFSRGALAHLLKNPLYVGDVGHKGEVYKGEHDAIIERELWDQAQALLAGNSHQRVTASKAAEPSLLAGMLRDGCGRPMSPSHATKGTLRYRYYVSRIDGASETAEGSWRVPAGEVEQLVVTQVASKLAQGAQLIWELAPQLDADDVEWTAATLTKASVELLASSRSEQRHILQQLAVQVSITTSSILIDICCTALQAFSLGGKVQAAPCEHRRVITLEAPAQVKKRGVELRLVFPPNDAAAPKAPDPKLIGLIAKAHDAWAALQEERPKASGRDTARDHLVRIAKLRFLAPDIVSAIMEGRQPANLTARQLLRGTQLPIRWEQQRMLLGFG